MPDFTKVKDIAYEILLQQEDITFPIDPQKLKIKNNDIAFNTFADHAALTGVSRDFITQDGELDNGYIIRQGNFNLILYNELHCPKRQVWTKTHELGHIACNHIKDFGKSEVEAHFFTSQTLMNDALIIYLIKNGISINITTLMYFFNVSYDSAFKKMSTLKKCSLKHKNDSDIIKIYQKDLDVLIEKMDIYNGLNYEFSSELCF